MNRVVALQGYFPRKLLFRILHYSSARINVLLPDFLLIFFMKFSRIFVSATLAAAMFIGAAPAFASETLPVPLVRTSGHENLRELYAKVLFTVDVETRTARMESSADLTGRSLLARSQIRSSQRNFRRHVLGYLRGLDYRVMNVSGDLRKRGVLQAGDATLPDSLVVTGAGAYDIANIWGWDRPTRRDVENAGTR